MSNFSTMEQVITTLRDVLNDSPFGAAGVTITSVASQGLGGSYQIVLEISDPGQKSVMVEKLLGHIYSRVRACAMPLYSYDPKNVRFSRIQSLAWLHHIKMGLDCRRYDLNTVVKLNEILSDTNMTMVPRELPLALGRDAGELLDDDAVAAATQWASLLFGDDQ